MTSSRTPKWRPGPRLCFCSDLYLHLQSAKAVRILSFLPGAVRLRPLPACSSLTPPSPLWCLDQSAGPAETWRTGGWLRPLLGIREIERKGGLCSRWGSCHLCEKGCCSNERKRKTTSLIRVHVIHYPTDREEKTPSRYGGGGGMPRDYLLSHCSENLLMKLHVTRMSQRIKSQEILLDI